MSSQDNDADIPLPVSVLLEQEHDEECVVFLDFDAFDSGADYTQARFVANSEITSAEYTITNEFSVPCQNISELLPGTPMEETRIPLNECSDDELETLFNMVSINYTIGTDAAEVDKN